MYTRSLITIFILLLPLFFSGCKSTQAEVAISPEEKEAFRQSQGEPVVISDPETAYEIIIIDPGFYSWLKSLQRTVFTGKKVLTPLCPRTA